MYYARVPFPGNLLLNQRKEFYVEREQIELTDFPRQIFTTTGCRSNRRIYAETCD